jgi:hypothetical protein
MKIEDAKRIAQAFSGPRLQLVACRELPPGACVIGIFPSSATHFIFAVIDQCELELAGPNTSS